MNTMMFKNRTYLITGAGQGIGFTIAERLAAQGAVVFLNDINEEMVKDAAQRIRSAGGNAIPMAGDAGDVKFIRHMVDAAVAQSGRMDGVVANAGITTFGDFFSYTPEAMQQLLQLNMAGTFFLTQAAARQMKLQPEGGSILLMSSVVGIQSHKYLAAYAMTKAAIQMLARNLVIELSPYRIRINTIAPGATITERTMAIEPEYDQTWSNLTPLRKPATTSDIADAALFLLSEQAAQITGQTLVVDGGWSAVSPAPGESHFKEVKQG